jgi:hypothetical protein
MRSEGAVWEESDQEILVVHPHSNTTWRLNETAAYIWRHCNGLTAFADREWAHFCETLERAGLLRPVAVPAPVLATSAHFSGNPLPAFTVRSLAQSRRRPTPRGGGSGPGGN